MHFERTITVIGAQVGGEENDVIVGGVLPPPGNTVFEKKRWLETEGDWLRRWLLFEPRGKPTLSLDVGTSPRSALAVQEEVLTLPERLAVKRKRRLVLVFDEFQEIQRFPGAGLEKAMRSHFQTHRHVSYLFAGSRQSALQDMANRERSPFYRFGRLVSLGTIPPKEFAPFLQARFRRGGLRLSAEIVDGILAAADDVPYNVQRLCHQLWTLRAGRADRITEGDIGDAIAGIVEQDAPHFSAGWDRLSLHQRQVLQAIARSGGQK